jgi:hypothetical protein
MIAVGADFPAISLTCVELRGMMQAFVIKRISEEKSPRRNFVVSNRGDGTPVENFSAFLRQERYFCENVARTP